jgi:hypothetical protein
MRPEDHLTTNESWTQRATQIKQAIFAYESMFFKDFMALTKKM